MKTIDINCDMGESFGRFVVGSDETIFPYITRCNIACGFHGGDPLHIDQTIRMALENKVRIGAHPSYPDLMGFGRRRMSMHPVEVRSIVRYQVAAIKSLTESLGGKLHHVKPHGALYNTSVDDSETALAIIEAVQSFGPDIYLMGLAGSMVESLAGDQDIPFLAEAFADRKYAPDGRLQSRSAADSVIADPAEAVAQVLSIVLKHEVRTTDGSTIPVRAQSICVHGDNPSAVPILRALTKALAEVEHKQSDLS
ncbi:MAG: LamB/YcsF family protein [Saprospiraceae bacterium]|nr:LamB/YcsF family protein [Saprospiraceae bacterium]